MANGVVETDGREREQERETERQSGDEGEGGNEGLWMLATTP